MSLITLDALIDYIICPLKQSYKEQPAEFYYNFYDVRSKIYSQLFDYCFYLKSSNDSITLYKLNAKLNYLWEEIKGKIVGNIGIVNKLSIKNKLNSFINLFNGINFVHYFSLPITITVNDTQIMFSIYTYEENYNFKTIVKANCYHLGLTDKSYSIKIMYNIIYNALSNLDSKKFSNISLYRTDTGDLYMSDLLDSKDITNIVDNITKSISNKIYYPRNDYLTCSGCKHKKDCSWSMDK